MPALIRVGMWPNGMASTAAAAPFVGQLTAPHYQNNTQFHNAGLLSGLEIIAPHFQNNSAFHNPTFSVSAVTMTAPHFQNTNSFHKPSFETGGSDLEFFAPRVYHIFRGL